MQEEKNSPVFLRPRFRIDMSENQQSIIERFEQTLNKPDCKFSGKIRDGHIVVDIPENENHFWSPQLHLEIESIDKDSSIAKGLFGPKPQVWTLFVFLHFGVAITFIGFLIRAYTQWSLKNNYKITLIVLILLPVFWFSMYFLGRIGKRTGHVQMQDLHDFMIAILENK